MLHMRDLVVAAAVVLAGCAVDDPVEQVVQGVEVNNTNLLGDLWGMGDATTGGLGGELYVVTSTSDSGEYGTLRYGVEQLPGTKRWIVFDSTVFPPGTKTPIYLTGALHPRENTTIDGRGSYVAIRKYAYKAGSVWTLPGNNPDGTPNNSPCQPNAVCECDVAGPGTPSGPLIEIRNVHNVIITHLEFQLIYVAGSVPAATLWDKQCFKDSISIVNGSGSQGTESYGDIWINASDFRDCGDECIAVTRPTTNSALERAYITISRNQFLSNSSDPFLAMYKGVLLGGLAERQDSDTFLPIAVSFYRNRFVGVRERQPRVERAAVQIYNNVFEDWKFAGVATMGHTRVMVEQNAFRAITRFDRAWERSTSLTNSYLWERADAKSDPGISGTASNGFATCGAWYYPNCDATGRLPSSEMTVVSPGMSYSTAINFLRPLAGWKNVANDVCPFPCHPT